MSAYFVAATGTGVGKTFATCALLHAARARGVDAHGFKPVISGWEDADTLSDVRQILAAGAPLPAGEATRLNERSEFSRSLSAEARRAKGDGEGAYPHAQPCPHPDLQPIAQERLGKSDLSQGRGGPMAQLSQEIQQQIDAISPWRFTAPLSPHRAAAMEGREMELDALVEWTRARCSGEKPSPSLGRGLGEGPSIQIQTSEHVSSDPHPTFPLRRGKASLTLIETVGGVMVPLTNAHTTLDWMEQVKLPVILVTGSYLGSISHTLTAILALRARGLTIAAIILNESADSTVTLAEAEAGLTPFIHDIPLRIVQPRVSSWKDAREIHSLVEKL